MTAVLISSILLFLCYTALLLYYRYGWKSIPSCPSQTPVFRPKTRVSVIIAARNEERNIGACLNSVCSQSYPEDLYEVLLVDDHSTDNTAAIISQYVSKKLTLISLKDLTAGNEFNSYKKKAIGAAIKQSTGELIVTTDADCIVNNNWLQTIVSFYEQYQPQFIAAPVAFLSPLPAGGEKPGERFLKIFQSLDFMTLQGITGASVYKKLHSMCNGANLAYTKKAFEEVGGFSGIDDIASGDDMLLMHKIYKRYPDSVMFLKSKEAIVQTVPVHTIKDFFSQRIRWASKANKYDDKRVAGVLLLVYLVNLSLLILPVIAWLTGARLLIIELWIMLLVLKTGIELFFLYPVAAFFNKQRLLHWFPLMEPFHILYTIVAGALGAFGSYTWKDRRVK